MSGRTRLEAPTIHDRGPTPRIGAPRGRAGPVLLLAAATGVLLLVPVPATGRLGRVLMDLAHVPIAAGLAWAAGSVLRARLPGRPLVAALLGFVFVAGFLGLLEALQPLVGRGGSWQDAWNGAFAAAGASAFLAGRSLGGAAATVASVAGVAGLLLACRLPVRDLYDVWRQRRDLPRLASFEDALELRRWSFAGASGRRSLEHATHGESSLAVDFAPGRWPSATLAGPPPDWTAYDALVFDVFVDAGGAIPLVVKVVDADHDGTYEDRFQQEMSLLPGEHRVEIPLARVAEGPVRRRLDLARVEAVQWFADGLDRPRTIHLDDVRLVRTPR